MEITEVEAQKILNDNNRNVRYSLDDAKEVLHNLYILAKLLKENHERSSNIH